MSFIQDTIDQVMAFYRQFMKSGYLDLYRLIFGTPQFPYWFVIQATWSSYIAIKNVEHRRKTIFSIIQQMIVACAMTFAPRELFAYITKQVSPINHNPQSVLIFVAVYLALNISVFFNLVEFFFSFLGMAQGANQARLFKVLLRHLKKMPPNVSIPFAVFFTVFDQILEVLFRLILSTKGTPLSSVGTIIQTVLFSLIFYASTHYNYFTQYIGHYTIYWPSLIFAFALGFMKMVSNLESQINNRLPQEERKND